MKKYENPEAEILVVDLMDVRMMEGISSDIDEPWVASGTDDNNGLDGQH